MANPEPSRPLSSSREQGHKSRIWDLLVLHTPWQGCCGLQCWDPRSCLCAKTKPALDRWGWHGNQDGGASLASGLPGASPGGSWWLVWHPLGVATQSAICLCTKSTALTPVSTQESPPARPTRAGARREAQRCLCCLLGCPALALGLSLISFWHQAPWSQGNNSFLSSLSGTGSASPRDTSLNSLEAETATAEGGKRGHQLQFKCKSTCQALATQALERRREGPMLQGASVSLTQEKLLGSPATSKQKAWGRGCRETY